MAITSPLTVASDVPRMQLRPYVCKLCSSSLIVRHVLYLPGLLLARRPRDQQGKSWQQSARDDEDDDRDVDEVNGKGRGGRK
eukprot:736341-Hanusia_phi.AAC.2